ncbi:hypothetical protein [Bacillus sp. AK031]
MIYEKAFDLNDWTVLISILVIWAAVFLLPKKFSVQYTVLIMLFGLTAASVFDNSLGAAAFDYYNIMDGPAYTLMDGAVYLLYPPFSYFFAYIHRSFHINMLGNALFILAWSLLSVFVESIFTLANVFTYKNGFNLFYSFCIYLVTQSALLTFMKLLEFNGRHSD